MNTKSLTILTIITIVVVIAAMLLTHKQTEFSESKPVLPNLMATINDVTEIEISTNHDKFTMVRNGDQWGLKEKHNYPVALDKVRSLLLGLADLTAVEAKTSNPQLYSKLEVEEVSGQEAKSTLLTVKNSKGETVASLIVGRSQTAKGDSTRNEIYIRKPEEKQAWLAEGFLKVDRMSMDWVEKKILDVESKRIRQVNITQPGGKTLRVFRDKVEQVNYQLADIPKGSILKAPYELGQIANALSYVNINDVTTNQAVKFDEKSSYQGVFTTFDGLEVTMTTTEQDSKYYAKFSAKWVPPVTPTVKPETEKKTEKASKNKEKKDKEAVKNDTLKTAEEVKKEIDGIKTKLSEWIFEIPKYKADVLSKKREELLTTEEAEKAKKTQRLSGADKPLSPFIEFGNATTVGK